MITTAPAPHSSVRILGAPTAPSRGRGGVVRLATASVLAGLAITASAGTAAAAPVTPVPTFTGSGSGLSGSSLQDMLLTAREGGRTLGVTLDEIATGAKLDATRVSPVACAGAYTPGAVSEYANADVQDIAVKVLSDQQTTSVTEIVVQLPTKKDALDNMAATADRWSTCQGRTVTASGKSWDLGSPVVNDARTMVTLSQTSSGSGRGTCERAIAVYRNVVVDVMTCSASARGEGAAIAQAIADKANSQPV